MQNLSILYDGSFLSTKCSFRVEKRDTDLPSKRRAPRIQNNITGFRISHDDGSCLHLPPVLLPSTTVSCFIVCLDSSFTSTSNWTRQYLVNYKLLSTDTEGPRTRNKNHRSFVTLIDASSFPFLLLLSGLPPSNTTVKMFNSPSDRTDLL